MIGDIRDFELRIEMIIHIMEDAAVHLTLSEMLLLVKDSEKLRIAAYRICSTSMRLLASSFKVI